MDDEMPRTKEGSWRPFFQADLMGDPRRPRPHVIYDDTDDLDRRGPFTMYTPDVVEMRGAYGELDGHQAYNDFDGDLTPWSPVVTEDTFPLFIATMWVLEDHAP